MNEQEHHRLAFERYAAMGAGRSLSRLACEMEVSESAVKLWSRAFGWRARLQERARQVSEALAKDAVKGEVSERLKEKQLVRLALFQIAKQLAEGRVRATMGDVDRMIRLDRALEEREGRVDRSRQSPFMQALLIKLDEQEERERRERESATGSEGTA